MSVFETPDLLCAAFEAIGGICAFLVGILTLIAASVAVVVVAGQLKQLVRQVKDGRENIQAIATQIMAAAEANKINRVVSLLTLENTIAERRLVLRETGIKLRRLIETNKSGKKIADFEIEGAKLQFNDAAEMYLNALDRWCFCFLNGLLSEEELRPDYRDLIENAVKKDFPEKFVTGTNLRNIVKVYERWIGILRPHSQ